MSSPYWQCHFRVEKRSEVTLKGMVRVHEVQRQRETQEFLKNLLTPWLVQVSNSLIH